MKSILLCGGKACCPMLVLLKDKKTFQITDDHGNTIQMHISQAKLIDKALRDILREDK